MDKVKSILGGGNKTQNDSAYDEDSYSQTVTHNSGRLTGEGTHLGAATGNTGPTSSTVDSTTSGPHSSDIMNKADPRVDSNAVDGNTTSSGFANKAASTAWSSPKQNASGQDDTSNPYAASSIDPRVDNAPRTQDTSAGTGLTTSTTDSPLGQSTGAGAGSTTSDTTGTSNKHSMVSRALGAVGLGGTATRADERTPTTTGTDSYGTSTQSGGLPSHHRKESIPTTAYPSGTLDSPRAIAPPAGVQASGNSTAVTDEPGVGVGTGRATVGQTSTYGSHYLGSGEPTSSVVDPESSDPTTYRKPETSNLGRDVGIGAAVGATGVGATSAYEGSKGRPVQSGPQSTAPSTTTAGEHAAFYDAATTGHQPTSSSGTQSTGMSPAYGTTSDHHAGRDAAAVGGGAAAVGTGAYEYEKHRRAEDPATGPSTGVGSTTGATTATSQPYDQAGDRHLGRDAAAGGGGAAAVGTGAYEYEKHRRAEDPATGPSTGVSSTTGATTTTSQPYDQAGDRHLGRDAATAGAGVGATAVGAHEYSKDEEKKLEKSERQHEKALEKEERHREKQHVKEEKAHDHHHHHHHHQKEDAAAAAGSVGAEAVGAHEYQEHEKERKPSLMQRILHPRSSRTTGQDETSGLGAADAADSRAFHEHGDAATMQKPNITPAGYAEAPTTGYASQVTGGTGTTALAQGGGGPSGSHATALGNIFESKDPSARSGAAPNYPTAEGQATGGATYTEPLSSGYASHVTGGTGTTALASGSSGEPLGGGGLGQGNQTGHQHGIHGSGMTRESMTGQPGTGHQFGEITDHNR